MQTDWLSTFIFSTKLIEVSHLTENEKYILHAYLTENKNNNEIAKEIELTNERVRQLIENALGKVFLTIKDLIAKSKWLEKTIKEKSDLEEEISSLKIRFKKQLAAEQQLTMNFDEANISINDMRISVRAKNALIKLGIMTLKDLSESTKSNLFSKGKVGVKTYEEIIRKAEEFGVKIQ